MKLRGRKERGLFNRGWRYALIGVFCALANNVLMIGTDMLGGHYLLGTTLAFLIVTPMAYLLHSQFTFDAAISVRALAKFVLGVASAYPIAVIIMAILCSGLKLPVVIAAPIATIALFLWNFVAAHWAIFPTSERGT